MKKIILTAIVIMMCVKLVDAQIGQGAMLIGGSFKFESETEKSKVAGQTETYGRRTSLMFNPQFGYFVADNFALGAGIGLSTFWWKDDEGDATMNGNEIVFGPFVRYYIKNLFIHGQAGFGVGKSKYEGFIFEGETKRKQSAYSLGLGYAIFLNNNVAIEPMVGYQSRSFKVDDEDEKDISAGLFLKLGIQVYLGR